MPYILKAKLPATLVSEMEDRYATLGTKYLTEDFTPEGRQINGMMYTDRFENCREEIVDAVFCILGQIFKEQAAGNTLDDNIYIILMGLIEIYSGLVYIEQSNNYVKQVGAF